MEFKYKKDNPDPEQRRKACDELRNKFPNKIPIICEKAPNQKPDLKEIDKTNFLVPAHFNVTQFNRMIRERLEMSSDTALYLLVNGKTTITGDTVLNDIYEKKKILKMDSFILLMQVK